MMSEFENQGVERGKESIESLNINKNVIMIESIKGYGYVDLD